MIALAGAYVVVNHLRDGIMDNYERYQDFWGGNPMEVFSHWLNMVLMSGSAVIIAWLTSVEACFRRSGRWIWCQWVYVVLVLCLLLSAIVAGTLDNRHGEGAVVIVLLPFFLPILASSYYLLRQLAARWSWRTTPVILLSIGFGLSHLTAQLFYEPSGTGGPNALVVGVWLGSVACALLWALVQGLRTGLLQQRIVRFIGVIRQPSVWGGVILLTLMIGIPILLEAQRTQKAHQEMAFAWLDELEAKLTDDFVSEIKRDHLPAKADRDSKIPISAAMRAVLTDPRIEGDVELRIYVPLNEREFIFLWGNDRFQYCDIRQMVHDGVEESDQRFIDALIAHGGTCQTGLFCVLWTPYMAGRVLKDKDGVVKAICVHNAP
jgi:hypothetical protein